MCAFLCNALTVLAKNSVAHPVSQIMESYVGAVAVCLRGLFPYNPTVAVRAPPRRCPPTCACVRRTPFYICICELFTYYVDIIYMYIYICICICIYM